MRNKKTQAVLIGTILLALLLGAVYFLNRPRTAEGTKHITVEVTDDHGQTTRYEENTDSQYLAAALEELTKNSSFTMETQDGDYGLYITSVNGLTADFSKDQSYWAVYVNGEYGSYGISEQPVTDKDVYTLAYEK